MGIFSSFSFQQFWTDLWNNFINVVRTMTVSDVIDILIMSYIIYQGIKIVRETRAGQLVKGIALLAALYVLGLALGLKTMTFIMQNIFQIGILALVVVFQPELRRALERLGRTSVTKVIPVLNPDQDKDAAAENVKKLISASVEAAGEMSAEKTGALMVFEGETRLGEIISTGTVVDAVPSASLIGNIFFKNSPLHDGAMILRSGKVYAAGCYLPLSENNTISRELGTRHRAALGMSENSDAMVVIVSEETGYISIAVNGTLSRNVSQEVLRKRLESFLLPESSHATETGEKKPGRKGKTK